MVKKYYSIVSKSNMGRLMAGLIILVIVIAKPFPLFTEGVVHAATLTYTYDSLNRITGVDYGNGGTITYTYDAAGNRLTLISTPPPDSTPPTTPVIIEQGAYTLNLAQLHALWNAADPETGLAECQYAIGATPQGSDLVGWTTFFCSNNSLTHSGLSLFDGVTYYISVKARNSAGLWSEIGSSDGIKALSFNGDYDGDGLTNGDEVNIHGTGPLTSDTDGDGMHDGWEVGYGLNPLNPADALEDADNDGFTNLKEYQTITDPNDPDSHPPLAIAGPDQNVSTSLSVTLDGSESSGRDGNLITFNWTETSKPLNSAAILSSPNVPKPSFTADKDGYYSYDLTVCDSMYCSGPDSVAVNAAALNVPPNANAGHDQKVLTGQPVLLDGSKANDPDNGPVPLIYLWSFLSVPAGSLLTDASIINKETPLPGFTPDIDGEYRFDLSVSDGTSTSHDQVIITAGTTTPPVANAGLDQIVQLGQGVILDDSGGYDQDGLPQPITYQWSFVSVPAGSSMKNSDITNANTVSAAFMPDIAGSYVLQLAVSDGEYTATDNVVVIVDGVSPNGSIIINNNSAWTNNPNVSLALNCTDGVNGTGCSQMRFSNDGITWTLWESYAAGRSWTLVSGNGLKTVYIQYKDNAGNISAAISDSIILQTQATVSVSLAPDSTSVPRGGTLGYTVILINTTNSSQTFKYWTYIKLPNSSRYPSTGELFGPVTVTLSAGQSRNAHLTHSIPTIAPLGTYTYFGQIGAYPVVFDSDSFQFGVTQALTLQKTIQTEWQLQEDIAIDTFEEVP